MAADRLNDQIVEQLSLKRGATTDQEDAPDRQG
jgi:hypothetical protein